MIFQYNARATLRQSSTFQHDSRLHILSLNLSCLTWKRISSTHLKRANTLIGNGKGSFQSSSIPSGGSIFPRLTRYMKYHRPVKRSIPFHFRLLQSPHNHQHQPSLPSSTRLIVANVIHGNVNNYPFIPTPILLTQSIVHP